MEGIKGSVVQRNKVAEKPTLITTVQRRVNKQKPLSLWCGDDVLHWLQKHMGEGYFIAYGNMFREHSVTGRSVQRLNESSLIRMGMKSRQHRNELLTKITILKLKSEMVELQDSVCTNTNSPA